MSLDEGSIGSVSFVLLAPLPPSGSDTMSIITIQPDVFSLLVASQPRISSVAAPSILLVTSSVIPPQAASPSSPVTPSISSVAKMDPSFTDAASFPLGSLQYLRKRLAQRDAEFAELDDECIQREEFVSFFKARLLDVKYQLAASGLDCDALREANDDLLKSRVTERT